MTMTFNLKDVIVEAVTALGGTGTAAEVTEYLKSKYGKEWKNIETIMDDLSVESESSFFPPEERVLRHAGSGKYSLREATASEVPESETLTHEAKPTKLETVNNILERTSSAYLAKLRQILDQPPLLFAESNIDQIPSAPGVYLIHDKNLEGIIYAEDSSNLKISLLEAKKGDNESSRFRAKLRQKLSLRSENEISDYVLANCSFQFSTILSFEERFRLENYVIALLAPVLNIGFKE